MLFRRKSTNPVGTTGSLQSDSTAADERSCPTLAKALKKLESLEHPHILDLGPFCGSSAVALADRGARVSVESFAPPEPPIERDKREDDTPVEIPFKIEQPDGSCDLVLAWESIDFTHPKRLAEVVTEFKRILAPGGQLLLLSRNATGGHVRKTVEESMGRFRVKADDRVVRENSGQPTRTRWVHPTREIERLLKPLSVQGIHLQRDQTREILALHKAP